MNAQDWIGVPMVAALLVASMATLSTPFSQRWLGPEQSRKCLHVGVGLATLSFPWLFATATPVLALAALTICWFELVRRYAPVRERFAAALHRVRRAGRGESCFAAGTALTFLIAGGDKLAFCLPMAVLALADAGAALAGQAYARRRPHLAAQGKSVVGSATFFVLALTCSLLALTIADWSIAPACMLSLIIACATTAVEAIVARGFDNLLIPTLAASLMRLAQVFVGGTP